MSNLFSKLQRKTTIQKSYAYSQDGITLNFTLDTNNKNELKTFIAMLVAAQTDVEADVT